MKKTRPLEVVCLFMRRWNKLPKCFFIWNKSDCKAAVKVASGIWLKVCVPSFLVFPFRLLNDQSSAAEKQNQTQHLETNLNPGWICCSLCVLTLDLNFKGAVIQRLPELWQSGRSLVLSVNLLNRNVFSEHHPSFLDKSWTNLISLFLKM